MSPSLTTSELKLETLDTARASIDWFTKFASTHDTHIVDQTLAQISKMNISRPQLINLGVGARCAVTSLERGDLENYSPNVVVECARIFFRVDQLLLAEGEHLARSQLRGGSAVGAKENFFVDALIKLHKEGHSREAIALLDYISMSVGCQGSGIAKEPYRGV